MSQIIPIKIPTYISSQEFAPARVLPRLFYYNGLVDCESYYIESGSLTTAGTTKEQTAFPYFDNYNVVTGSFPTTDSNSLLFTNEAAAYGEIPTASLYSEYWERYISLLYNPTTRLVACEAIIPLADYFKMELNDIVQWRGNYYHLRAINDYNLSNGECNLQLLGPILDDILPSIIPAITCDFDFTIGCLTPTTTAAPTTLVPTTLVPTTTVAPTTLVPTTTAAPTTLVPTTTLTPTTLTPTTTLAPTTTTAAPLEVYSGCGYGNSVAEACNDASVYSRTLYSNCSAGVFGVGCIVYVDAGGNNPLTGYTNVFMNGANWDINSSTGVITSYSSVQC
jgi:hypothetical protein